MIKNNTSDCFRAKKTDWVLSNLHPNEIDFVLMFEAISFQKVKRLTQFFDTLMAYMPSTRWKIKPATTFRNQNWSVKKIRILSKPTFSSIFGASNISSSCNHENHLSENEKCHAKRPKLISDLNRIFFTDVYLFADSIQSSVCPLVDRNPHISVSQILEIENEIQTVIWSFSLMILHLWDRFEHSDITSEKKTNNSHRISSNLPLTNRYNWSNGDSVVILARDRFTFWSRSRSDNGTLFLQC